MRKTFKPPTALVLIRQFFKNNISLLLFLILFLIGLVITPDFGVSFDEPAERNHRLVALKRLYREFAVMHRLPKDAFESQPLEEYRDRFYGMALQAPLILLEFTSLTMADRAYWLVSHYYTHALFLVSVLAFYSLMKGLSQSRDVALAVSALYVLSPRIYADSFYNIKDAVFLSIVTISLYCIYRYLSTKQLKQLLVMAVVAALTVNTRVVGLLCMGLSALAVLLAHFKSFQTLMKHLSILVLVFAATLFVIWPVLWTHTLENITEVFTTFSKYSWSGQVLFNGQLIDAQQVPTEYIPYWIATTVPLGILFLWILSIAAIPFMMHAFKKQKVRLFFLLSSILIIATSVGAAVYFNSTLYNGWRHMYFLHAPLSVLVGLLFIFLQKKSRKLLLVAYLLVIATSLHTVIWMVRNHPHYYVYFNSLAGQEWSEKWEGDYWGLSKKQAFERIAELDSSARITVNDSHTNYWNLQMLPPKDKRRFKLVKDNGYSEYIVISPTDVGLFKLTERVKNYEIVDAISVDNEPITLIYKSKDAGST